MSKTELQRPEMLDHRGYGYWKTRMMQLIRGQGEDAWTAVEDGWEAPFSTTEAGLKVKKPKANWTDAEKSLSKFNARAMNTIYSCLDDNEFNLVQGSESAKQIWDILQKSHEGNTSVKHTRLDQLATDFENLKIDPAESIVQFSSKLSGIANEAKTLGKIYKEKILVKKLLRCLPLKYAAHKAVMRVSGNTYTLKYEDLVGILKSEEIEVAEDQRNLNKELAFKADEEKGPDPLQEIRDNMSLMARNFGKALKHVERGKNRGSNRWNRGDAGKSGNRSDAEKSGNRSDAEKSGNRSDANKTSGRRRDLKCHEYGGMGHTRPECLVAKRKDMKCYECNGVGHLKSECPSAQKDKEKSFLRLSNSESDSDDATKVILNFVAFSAKDDDKSGSEDSDSDDDGELITSDNFHTLYDSWVLLSNDKLQLTKENLMLVAKVNMLEEEAKEEKVGEKLPLLEKQIFEKKMNLLQEDFFHGNSWISRIGYQPYAPKASLDVSKTVQFVKSTIHHEEEAQGVKTVEQKQQSRKTNQDASKNATVRDRKVEPRKKWTRSNRGRTVFDCFYCGKPGHTRNFCYKFQDKIKQFWQTRKCFIEPSKFCKVRVRKRDLYNKDPKHDEEKYKRAVAESKGISLTCNVTIAQLDESDEDESLTAKVAYTSTDGTVSNPWYFDSGCSRHMTGDPSVLSTFTEEAIEKVTFGDGGKRRIKGKGNIEGDDKPSFINVFYVEGLKANLICISQLCDDGLKVIFTRTDCKAVDENGNIVLCGVRSGITATCGRACNKGKQIKVNHKKVPEIVTKKVLELIHMDLMGPVQVESINGKKYIFVLVDDFSRVYVKPGTKTTSYEIWMGKSPNLSYFRVFGCVCYIRNDKEHFGKFDSRSDEGIFLGYSTNSSAYRVYNKRTKVIGDAVNVVFDDKNRVLLPPVLDEFIEEPAADKSVEEPAVDESVEASAVDESAEAPVADEFAEAPTADAPETAVEEKVNDREISSETQSTVAPSATKKLIFSCFVSLVKPKNIAAALEDEFLYGTCTEELNQFSRNEVWDLVPRPAHINVVGTMWIFKNKIDEDGQTVDQKLYRAMIGCFMYLTASRPDLCHSVGVCARYQASPRVSHLNAVKRIIKYVKGTVKHGLSYTKHTNQNLPGFCDADYAGCLDDRRSTTGGCFFLGNNLIAWHSKKQNCVSLSSTQAEYIAMGSYCT
ncbi:Zinc finger CCHC-type superfamily [Arabidopsis suecica]|uniref:Zinc finger CCHC-type superfamily n=1 Tax=Arabidopsis suecica TaxID=45249 RepID=A0A8T1ZV44_ARASU|nr:Zinc finger CCHC-type superfamily [Arabidopsis suecica]